MAISTPDIETSAANQAVDGSADRTTASFTAPADALVLLFSAGFWDPLNQVTAEDTTLTLPPTHSGGKTMTTRVSLGDNARRTPAAWFGFAAFATQIATFQEDDTPAAGTITHGIDDDNNNTETDATAYWEVVAEVTGHDQSDPVAQTATDHDTTAGGSAETASFGSGLTTGNLVMALVLQGDDDSGLTLSSPDVDLGGRNMTTLFNDATRGGVRIGVYYLEVDGTETADDVEVDFGATPGDAYDICAIEINVNPLLSGAASLTATATLTTAGRKTARGAASLTGTATLTATGTSSGTKFGAASLTGTATLATAGRKVARGAASLTGTATLTAAGAVAGAVDAGAYALVSGSGQAIPGTSWGAIDMGSIDTDADGILSESSGVFTPQIEGYYLIIAEARHQITHNNRHNWEMQLHKNGAGIAGGINSGYARNSTNDLSYAQLAAVAHFNGSSDTFDVEHRREVGDATPAGTYDWTRIKVVLLATGASGDTPYGHYGTPTTATLGGNTPTATSGWDVITETDTDTIELQAGGTDIRLKEADRPYLLVYGLRMDGGGNTRTGRIADVTLDGTRIAHSVDAEYRRDSGTSYCAPAGIALAVPDAADEDLNVRMWGRTVTSWGTWSDGATCELDSAAGLSGVMVVALPTTLDFAIWEDTTGGETVSGSGEVDIHIADVAVSSNGSKFTRDNSTDVTVPGAHATLAVAAVLVERTAASATRHTFATRFEREGTNETTDTEQGDYGPRGDQGSADHYNGSACSVWIGDTTANDTFQFEKFDPGTDDGANDAVAFAGSFFIDLTTLPVAASGPKQGAASLTATASLATAGRKVARGAAALTGTATLSSSGRKTARGAASLTGTATVTVSGQRTAKGASALTGTASLSVAGGRIAKGAASLTGTATLTATGNRSGTKAGSASLEGTATLSATGRKVARGAASLTGTATVTSSGTPTRRAAASLTGTATLTATGSKQGKKQGTASLEGTATLSATGRKVARGAASLTGTASVVTVGKRTAKAVATLTGTATLTADGRKIARGAASLVGTATLTVEGRIDTTPFTIRVGPAGPGMLFRADDGMTFAAGPGLSVEAGPGMRFAAKQGVRVG